MQTSQSDRSQSGNYVKCRVSYTASGHGLTGFALPSVIKWSILWLLLLPFKPLLFLLFAGVIAVIRSRRMPAA